MEEEILEYQQIALNKQIYTINDDKYRGYWNGKYKGDEFNGVYQDLKIPKNKSNVKYKYPNDFIEVKEYDFDKIQEEFNLDIEQKKIQIDAEQKKIQEDSSIKPEKNIFDELLWTHNMPLSIFYKILISSDDKDAVLRPSSKGLFFRYGVDSQYGEVIFIMKPGFFYKYSTRQTYFEHLFLKNKDGITDRYWTTSIEIKEKLKKDANMFSYRILNKDTDLANILASFSGNECNSNTWNNSWCNMQMTMHEDVYFNDVLFVLLPEWIKEKKNTDGLDDNIPENLEKICICDESIFNTNNKKFLRDKFKYYNANLPDSRSDNDANSYYSRNDLI